MSKTGRNDPCPCGSGKKHKDCCLQITFDNDRLKEIIKNLFDKLPQDIKSSYPKFLFEPGTIFTCLLNSDYFMLLFLSDVESKRFNDLKNSGLDPFPGLITVNDVGAAFRLDKSRNVVIDGCTVKNSYAISLGKDNTIVIIDHNQTINTKELGLYNYIVELAYIVSFGSEINHDNMYEFLEDLIVYSISKLRSK